MGGWRNGSANAEVTLHRYTANEKATHLILLNPSPKPQRSITSFVLSAHLQRPWFTPACTNDIKEKYIADGVVADMESPTLTTSLLSALLPPDLVDSINKHVLHPRAPVQILLRHVLVQAQNLLDTAAPIIEPLFDRLMTAMAENQGLVGVIASLLVLATFLIILNWIRRLLMWWTRLAMRVATWAILFAIAAWVWERGVFESAKDMAIAGGKVAGYLAVIKDVWLEEYNKYEAQQGMAGSSGTRSGARSR
ncbi:hypothetical protein CEP54_003225 [Fusarium duplospermum]|uniref:Uncharacterized protein n=1 Tax=Fusarium duplospermum TaxID=1325734 RepID=A0A428QQA0_9HYPO|nr:hypothetical protein CEP54_003225 [Fusarium duplospermum]